MKDTTIFHDAKPVETRPVVLALQFFCLFLTLQACSSFQVENGRNSQENTPQNLFNVSGQIITDQQIRSVQLYRNNNPDSPPVIELNSSDKLQLRFDYLDVSSKQFSVTFSHHNIDWSLSPLAPSDISQGIRRVYLDAGYLNSSNRPLYRTYSVVFPNEQISFLKSGNYMLRIEDMDTGYLVMALPFFIYENEGSLESSVEFLQSPRQNLRLRHRPVNRYRVPDFVEQPQFNLMFSVVQNRFWGRSKTPEETDFSSPGIVMFEMTQEEAFIADYYFYPLFANDLTLGNPRVNDVYPEEIPPRILLRDDTVNLGTMSARNLPGSSFGLPDGNSTAQYMKVVFSLDTEQNPEPGESLYLVGDFTGWAIRSENRMVYQDEINRWQTSSIIKEGEYKYKYVKVENNGINDLFYDPLFERTKQEYQVFVYLKDKDQFYDRLLQVNIVTAGS